MQVVGTIGYAAPEYIQTGRLTAKSDVWGYGVFLYELITGRRPLDRNRPKNEQKLLEWIRPHLSDSKKFQLILDPRLEGKYTLKSAQKLAAVANRCLVRQVKARPKMSEILDMLNRIVEAAETGSPQPAIPFSTPEKSRGRRLKRRLLVWQKWRPKLVRTSWNYWRPEERQFSLMRGGVASRLCEMAVFIFHVEFVNDDVLSLSVGNTTVQVLCSHQYRDKCFLMPVLYLQVLRWYSRWSRRIMLFNLMPSYWTLKNN